MANQIHSDSIIEAIRSRAEANPDIVILWLYGSRANDTAGEASDYDLAIAFRDFPTDNLQRHVRPEQLAMEWVSELELEPGTISAIDINLAPIPLAGEVINTGRVIVSKDALRRYREENRISGMIELDWQHHRQHYG